MDLTELTEYLSELQKKEYNINVKPKQQSVANALVKNKIKKNGNPLLKSIKTVSNRVKK